MDQRLPPLQLHSPGQNGRAQAPQPFVTHPAGGNPCDRPADAVAPVPHRGSPLLFDHAKRLQYCNLLNFGLTKGKAARIVGVSPRSVQEAVKNDPELANRIQQARLISQSRAAAQIALAGQKSWRAAAWLLEQGKRRRGPGRPCKTSSSDSLRRDDMKQLVRNVLLEVMPELRQQIIAPPAPIPPSPSVSPHLPQKHLPGVPRHISPSPAASPSLPRYSAHPNAQQFPAPFVQPSSETNAPHQLGTDTPAAATSIIAQNP